MNYELAKRNRLNGKFSFKLRDWQVELDGVDDPPRKPLKDRRPMKPKVIWERNGKKRYEDAEEQDAG